MRSRLRVLYAHLLKWAFQPSGRSRSWRNSIAVQRRDILRHLRDNPSLRATQVALAGEAYEDARFDASTETDMDLETFPADAPFSLEQALNPEWFPEAEDSERGAQA